MNNIFHCIYCTGDSTPAYWGYTKAIACRIHAKENMRELIKRCHFCTNVAWYGPKNKPFIYCADHSAEYMDSSGYSICKYAGCWQYAKFTYPLHYEKYCAKHAYADMIRITDQCIYYMCINCAEYGTKKSGPLYCSHHVNINTCPIQYPIM